jgi:hypothetical protein
MEFPLGKKCETWMLAMGTNEKHGGIDSIRQKAPPSARIIP